MNGELKLSRTVKEIFVVPKPPKMTFLIPNKQNDDSFTLETIEGSNELSNDEDCNEVVTFDSDLLS